MRLKIFDLFGNEIQTLVIEEKAAGTYEVTWHAINLLSEVCFYRMQVYPAISETGNFIGTKKMILIK